MILKQKVIFDSSHRLLNYDGNCKNCHGHSWIVEIEIESNRNLDPCGMLFDYRAIKNYVKNKWDHRAILNEDDPLVEIFRNMDLAVTTLSGNPTAENIAKNILSDMVKLVNIDPENSCDYCSVIVHESNDNSAEENL